MGIFSRYKRLDEDPAGILPPAFAPSGPDDTPDFQSDEQSAPNEVDFYGGIQPSMRKNSMDSAGKVVPIAAPKPMPGAPGMDQAPPDMQAGAMPDSGSGMMPPAALPNAPRPPASSAGDFMKEYAALKAPEKPKANIWQKLGAAALGGAAGFSNANPRNVAVDPTGAQQAILLGPKYMRDQQKYEQTRADLTNKIGLADKVEDIANKAEGRRMTAENHANGLADRRTVNGQADADRKFKYSLDMAQMGGQARTAADPLAPGAVRLKNPTDPTGKSFVDIIPTKATQKVTDPQLAKDIGVQVGTEVPQSLYLEGLKRGQSREDALAKQKDPVTKNNPNQWIADANDPTKSPEEQSRARQMIKDSQSNAQQIHIHNAAPSTNYGPSEDGTPNATIESMAHYDIDVPRPRTSSPTAMAEYNKIIAAIKKSNPKYDATVFPSAQKTINAFNSGRPADSVNAINTAAGHVGVLAQAAKALDSGDITLLNRIANAYGTQTGNDKLSVYKTIVHRLAPEITRSYVGAGGGEGDRVANESDFDQSLGTKRILANLGITANLYQSKINALGHQFEKGAPGRKFEGYITPEAQGVFDSFRAPQQQQQQQQGGKSYTQADVSAAVAAHPGYTAQQIEDGFRSKGYVRR